jgi:hypothetical protein
MSSYAHGGVQNIKYHSDFITNDDGRITKLSLYRQGELSILPCPKLGKLDCLTEIEKHPDLLLRPPESFGNLSKRLATLKADLGDVPGNLPLSFNSLPMLDTFICLQSRDYASPCSDTFSDTL